MRIIITGAAGHMGRAVAEAAKSHGVDVACRFDPHAAEDGIVNDWAQVPAGCADALIDFSHPSALPGILAYCARSPLPLVLATTGYGEEELAGIAEAAKSTPVFRSANMSVGIALLRRLAKETAEALGEDFDIEIVEAHHNRKKDAPSGTALMLYEAVKNAGMENREAVCGRSGRDCARQKREVGLHAVRGGTVTGEHQVLFLGPMERITLSHSAENRAVFAEGALRAAAYLQGRQPGLYSMDDLVNGL